MKKVWYMIIIGLISSLFFFMPDFKDKPVIEGIFHVSDKLPNISDEPPEENENPVEDGNENKPTDNRPNEGNLPNENEKPSDNDNNKDKTKLENLTLEEKVGQMFIVRNPTSNAVTKIKEYNLGGYILFARDFANKNKNQVKTMISNYQNAASIPMLIGVDEEGGTVTRVSKYPALRSEPFASPQDIYTKGGMEAIKNDTIEKSKFLKSFGININFAPVSDVSTDPNDYIYKRTFGKDAVETAEYVKIVVSNMKNEKIGSVLKHFPGYGNNIDTHTGIAKDPRSLEYLRNNDFLPFASGINNGANVVMVSHNIILSIDSSHPASLSKAVHEVIRNELNFNGVIVTDDLSMGAIKQYTGTEEAAVAAVLAGNDLICCTDFEIQIPAVINAVKSGKISEERINESVAKILKMKKDLGIISS